MIPLDGELTFWTSGKTSLTPVWPRSSILFNRLHHVLWRNVSLPIWFWNNLNAHNMELDSSPFMFVIVMVTRPDMGHIPYPTSWRSAMSCNWLKCSSIVKLDFVQFDLEPYPLDLLIGLKFQELRVLSFISGLSSCPRRRMITWSSCKGQTQDGDVRQFLRKDLLRRPLLDDVPVSPSIRELPYSTRWSRIWTQCLKRSKNYTNTGSGPPLVGRVKRPQPGSKHGSSINTTKTSGRALGPEQSVSTRTIRSGKLKSGRRGRIFWIQQRHRSFRLWPPRQSTPIARLPHMFYWFNDHMKCLPRFWPQLWITAMPDVLLQCNWPSRLMNTCTCRISSWHWDLLDDALWQVLPWRARRGMIDTSYNLAQSSRHAMAKNFWFKCIADLLFKTSGMEPTSFKPECMSSDVSAKHMGRWLIPMGHDRIHQPARHPFWKRIWSLLALPQALSISTGHRHTDLPPKSRTLWRLKFQVHLNKFDKNFAAWDMKVKLFRVANMMPCTSILVSSIMKWCTSIATKTRQPRMAFMYNVELQRMMTSLTWRYYTGRVFTKLWLRSVNMSMTKSRFCTFATPFSVKGFDRPRSNIEVIARSFKLSSNLCSWSPTDHRPPRLPTPWPSPQPAVQTKINETWSLSAWLVNKSYWTRSSMWVQITSALTPQKPKRCCGALDHRLPTTFVTDSFLVGGQASGTLVRAHRVPLLVIFEPPFRH